MWCRCLIVSAVLYTTAADHNKHLLKKKEITTNVKLLDNVQHLIGHVQTVIDNNIQQQTLKNTNIETFTDFIKHVAKILYKYEDTDLELFFNILNEEMEKYHYKGCKFYELTENITFRNLIAVLLDAVKYKTAKEIRTNIKEIIKKIYNILHEKNGRKLILFVNTLYGKESVRMFKKFLINIDGYRLRTRKDMDLSLIVREGVRSLIFDHYTRQSLSTRRALKSIIDESKRELRRIIQSLSSLTENKDSITVKHNHKIDNNNLHKDTTKELKLKRQITKDSKNKKKERKVPHRQTVKKRYVTQNSNSKSILRLGDVPRRQKQKLDTHLTTTTRQSKRSHKRQSVNWLTLAMPVVPPELKHRLSYTNDSDKHTTAQVPLIFDEDRPIGRMSNNHKKCLTKDCKNKKSQTKHHNITTTTRASVTDNFSRMQWLEKQLKDVESQKNKYAKRIQDLENRMQQIDKEHEELLRYKEANVTGLNFLNPSLKMINPNYIRGQIDVQINVDDLNNQNNTWPMFRDGDDSENQLNSNTAIETNHNLNINSNIDRENRNFEDNIQKENTNEKYTLINAKNKLDEDIVELKQNPEFTDKLITKKYSTNNSGSDNVNEIKQYINEMNHAGGGKSLKDTKNDLMFWHQESDEGIYDSDKTSKDTDDTDGMVMSYYRRGMDQNGVERKQQENTRRGHLKPHIKSIFIRNPVNIGSLKLSSIKHHYRDHVNSITNERKSTNNTFSHTTEKTSNFYIGKYT